ncbi:hypothetical protein GCM10009504_08090 [Pseudomonas laurentiana]|uniref:hypothetical protein n=1 Tax=Pseudomonas laurentiana TaxID=2364649 RepID=UPI001679DD46|nr:hypothetical protein [Pseudomonas laurentiana]GGU53677.1 hypothetical protein GCM10009504_08090 [Pseudomonas laurentiana]
MHPAMQERVKGVAAFHLRERLTPSDLCAMMDQPDPVELVRYQVVSGKKIWSVIERSTGKPIGQCPRYQVAMYFAQAMETAADQKLVPRQ